MKEHFNIAYLLLGGNMGNRIEYLNRAKELIDTQIGMIVATSSIYETESWGKTDLPPHLNQAICVETKLDNETLLNSLQDIEIVLGRQRIEQWGARKIDIDVIFFNNEEIQTKRLVVPHPHMQNRRFALVPLNEIATNYLHPRLNKTVAELLESCTDPLEVIIWKEQ